MTDRPIIFSGQAVRALLSGAKTQTRLVEEYREIPVLDDPLRLWVREAWCVSRSFDDRSPDKIPRNAQIDYLDNGKVLGGRNRSATHLPRWASRLTLLVTEVRIHRLHDITIADIVAEGTPNLPMDQGTAEEFDAGARSAFTAHWNDMHGKNAWQRNPWVAGLSFDCRKINIDDEREVGA